jgi:hypothetical protein
MYAENELLSQGDADRIIEHVRDPLSATYRRLQCKYHLADLENLRNYCCLDAGRSPPELRIDAGRSPYLGRKNLSRLKSLVVSRAHSLNGEATPEAFKAGVEICSGRY